MNEDPRIVQLKEELQQDAKLAELQKMIEHGVARIQKIVSHIKEALGASSSTEYVLTLQQGFSLFYMFEDEEHNVVGAVMASLTARDAYTLTIFDSGEAASELYDKLTNAVQNKEESEKKIICPMTVAGNA